MNDAKLYYTAPSDQVFEDMKKACLEVWKQYENEPGDYYESKVSQIKDIGNIKDNFMYMFAMFDSINQRKCVDLLNEQTKQELRERIIDGGNDESYFLMIGL